MHSTRQNQPFFTPILHSQHRNREHPKRTHLSNFEFNMSSNWISISAKKDANYTENIDNNIRYQISVMPISHVVERRKHVSKSGDNMCNDKGTRENEWVLLNNNQYNDASSSLQNKKKR